MAKNILPKILNEGEIVAADSGYRGHLDFLMTPVDVHKVVPRDQLQSPYATSLYKNNRVLKVLGSRHEIINKRIKDFNILNSRYREKDRGFHDLVFLSVANITQLNLREAPVFTVDHFLNEIFQ